MYPSTFLSYLKLGRQIREPYPNSQMVILCSEGGDKSEACNCEASEKFVFLISRKERV